MRISAKRQRAPLVLSPEQVKQDLAEVQFRDQLLVFLIGALGTRRGEVGALRCDGLRLRQPGLLRPTLLLLAQERVLEGDQNGSICETSGDASRAEKCLLEWRAQSLYITETDFVFPSVRNKGRKPLDLGAVLNRMIKPAFAKLGIAGVGWHTFRHSVGSILADMGEHQLTIRDYLRHSNLNVTNQYLQATSKTKRLAQEKLVDAILPSGSLSQSKSTLIQ